MSAEQPWLDAPIVKPAQDDPDKPWLSAPLAGAADDAPGKKASRIVTAESKAAPAPWYERMGTGAKDVLVGGAQLGARFDPGAEAGFVDDKARENISASMDDIVKRREQGIEAERKAAGQTGTDWWRVAGNTLATIPLAAANPLLAGAAAGAVTPVTEGDYGTEKAKQIAIGAAGGKLAEVGGNALAKLFAPVTDAAKSLLLKGGVNLTPGQLSGSVGKRAEEAVKSLPFAGTVVREGEARALDSFNVATTERALEPLGVKITAKTGRDAIKEGQAALGDAYDKVLVKIPQLTVDPEFSTTIANLRSMASEMPKSAADQFESILNNRVGTRFGPNGTMDGKTLKQVESELTNKASGLKASSDESQRQVGHALDEVKGAIREALGRQYPDQAAELAAVNKAYSQFTNVELAASRRAGSEGRFTPGDLLQAIKRGDRSPRDRQFAAGTRPLQDWAESANKVMGNKLPDSGTSERWAHLNLPSLVSGLAAVPLTVGHTGAGMALLRDFALAAPQTRNMLATISRQGGNALAPAAAVGTNALIGQ